MHLLNRYRKLRHMTAAEIRWRLAQRKLQNAERRAFRRGDLAVDLIHGDCAGVALDLCRRAGDLLPGHGGYDLQLLKDDRPEVYDGIRSQSVERANRIRDGVIAILGYDFTWQPGHPIDWHRDPRSDYRWRQDFYGDVRVYDLPGDVDVKYVWELNRHQFLVELGRAWLLTGREEYVEPVCSLLLDWIDKNPYLAGVNWTSGLEVAMRALSWMWVLASTATWPGWGVKERQTIARSLAEHAHYLSGHLSLYTSPYNHLIGESTALYLLGIWLRGTEEADQWQRTGYQMLMEHGPQQFYTDGFSVEQAVAYHFFTLGFLCQAVVAARQVDEPMPKLESAVARAFQTGYAMRQPDRRWPPIGDFDSARSVPVYPNDYWNFQGLCSLSCVLFDLPSLKSEPDGAGAELYWLLGAEGVAEWERIECSLSSGSTWQTVLPESGYVVAGKAGNGVDDWLLFDAGPLAHGLFSDSTPSTAHGHADVLQTLLFQHGRPILTDSGISSYAGDREWIKYFRGPSAHNTLEIDGAAVARAADGLAWSHVQPQISLQANISDDAWLLRGRVELSRGAAIVRTVFAFPGRGVWIADFLEGCTNVRARWHWHLPQALGPLQALDGEARGASAVRHAQGVIVQWSNLNEAQMQVQLGEDGSPLGWQATNYGTCEKAYRVTCECMTSGRNLVVTFIGPQVVPAIVEMHGLSLQCGDSAVGLHPSEPFSDPDSARITIVRAEHKDVYVMGSAAQNSSDDYSPLVGEGNWPAVHKRYSSLSTVCSH